MKAFGDLLPDQLKRKGIERQVDATRICALWDDAVRNRCEPHLAVHSGALSFSGGVLVVGVAHSSVGMELQYVQHVLRVYIHEHLGQTAVERVQFRVMDMGSA